MLTLIENNGKGNLCTAGYYSRFSVTDKPNSELQISPFVKSLSSGIKIPADFDYKKDYADHLEQKHR